MENETKYKHEYIKEVSIFLIECPYDVTCDYQSTYLYKFSLYFKIDGWFCVISK